MSNARLKPWLPLLGALLIAAVVKAGLLVAGVVPFNADEAVVGLMARHILQGERPVFFYGQAYLGSLDAWLIAGGFALFGQSVLVIRLVQTVLYLGTLLTTYLLALRIYSNAWIARAAALFLAVPTVLVTLYTTATLGGYGEALLVGNILFLLALKLGDPPFIPPSPLRSARETPDGLEAGMGGQRVVWLAFGLLGGLGFWGFALTIVYLIPAVVYLIVAGRRSVAQWLLFALGFVVGAAPWVWFTLTNGLTTLAELSGSAIAGASPEHPVFAAFAHLFNLLLFGLTVVFGLRPPWSALFLALPLAPFALAIYTALLAHSLGRTLWLRDSARGGRWLLLGGAAMVVGGFIFTPFGADPSGRYFLPLAVPVALTLAEMLHALRAQRRWLAASLALGVVAFNWWGTAQSAARFPPGLTTQFDEVAQVDHRSDAALITFLREHGELHGYSNYWVEFPLAFLSNEEITYEARLPYHLDFRYTSRDNRYAPYSRAVDASPRVAYITTRHPPLDDRLRTSLQALGVTFAEQEIGDFHIFYALSRKVTPEELGLGTDCCPK